MIVFDHSAVKWRKSSRSSAQGGDCVELAGLAGLIAVRDSKNPTGPVLTFDVVTFSAFLDRLQQ
jgi:hypothetical protein